MSLVLIHADKGEWADALAPLENLIAEQAKLPPDERSTGALSFALFWAGRVYLEQNRLADAEEMWRRVASEYYSTYYGAIGHYLLEKATGKRLALQPQRTPPFRMNVLRDAFSPLDRARVRRVEALMRIGLQNEAACELEELDIADAKPEKLLVKALMMHAAGHWLDAIKAYDALPRSYRNTLATGFERILFPIKYQSEIKALAEKAQVDPDLVTAIIRQESVFNPAARSPVGAMGLMQLMPATASMELKRVEPGYMPPEERKMIKQRLGKPASLLVADTNLVIGVHHVRTLLGKYGSPVYVLSAYNASPAAAQRWMTTIPTKDVLAFIEKIPYKETRAYVKLVLRNYFYYKRWYGDPKGTMKHLDAVTSPLVAMVEQDLNKITAPNH
jgi:soluble lytic murein transglycosylase